MKTLKRWVNRELDAVDVCSQLVQEMTNSRCSQDFRSNVSSQQIGMDFLWVLVSTLTVFISSIEVSRSKHIAIAIGAANALPHIHTLSSIQFHYIHVQAFRQPSLPPFQHSEQPRTLIAALLWIMLLGLALLTLICAAPSIHIHYRTPIMMFYRINRIVADLLLSKHGLYSSKWLSTAEVISPLTLECVSLLSLGIGHQFISYEQIVYGIFTISLPMLRFSSNFCSKGNGSGVAPPFIAPSSSIVSTNATTYHHVWTLSINREYSTINTLRSKLFSGMPFTTEVATTATTMAARYPQWSPPPPLSLCCENSIWSIVLVGFFIPLLLVNLLEDSARHEFLADRGVASRDVLEPGRLVVLLQSIAVLLLQSWCVWHVIETMPYIISNFSFVFS